MLVLFIGMFSFSFVRALDVGNAKNEQIDEALRCFNTLALTPLEPHENPHSAMMGPISGRAPFLYIFAREL